MLVETISAEEPRWYDKPVSFDMLTPEVVRPILWELCECSFRRDFLRLNNELYSLCTLAPVNGDEEEDTSDWGPWDAASWHEREVFIMSGAFEYWGGSLQVDHGIKAEVGFASKDIRERARTLAGMWNMMLSWTDMVGKMRAQLPEEYATANSILALSLQSHISSTTLDNAEYAIVLWYIDLFTEMFNRQPVLPHYCF